MIDINKRRQDVIKLIEKLDISPTMFKIATERYKSISNFLQEKGLNIDVYPQGSFSLGTVVRPYRNSEDANYDLDFICLLDLEKKNTTPKEVKNIIGDTLKSNEVYKKIMQEEWDRCWTLEYAEVNDIGFNIDIVPAVREDERIIARLRALNVESSRASVAIAITNKNGENYSWSQSNPKGYKEWFNDINAHFLNYNREEKRRILFESNRTIYNSIEDVPEDIERSSLQRVIQVLKRHRDVYFTKRAKEEYKPISAIITTVAARIANTAPKSLNVLELLEYIVKEFEIYSEATILNEDEFSKKYTGKKIITKKQGKWLILNPVNPEDNFADSWNNESRRAQYFFEWVRQIKKDFIGSFSENDRQFISILENSLGNKFVNLSIDTKNYNPIVSKPIVNTPKPWRF